MHRHYHACQCARPDVRGLPFFLLLLVLLLAGPVLAEPAKNADAKPVAAFDADLSSFSAHLSKLAGPARLATVGIVIPGGSMGSGVIINEEGLILTAAHVLPKEGKPIVIVLHDGTQLKGESLGRNDRVDSAMARIAEPGSYPFAPIAEANTVWEGDWCVAFGHGGGVQTDRPAPMRLGRVLHVSSDTSQTRWITTDTTVISGDSGGPLFNLKGEVIGIHSNIGMSVLVNRHVPISAYHAQWDEMLKPGNEINQPPPIAEPIIPGLDELPDSLERELARRLNEGDTTLREQLEQMRNEIGRINITPEKAAELFGREDLLDDLRAYQDKLAQRKAMTDKIKNADAGGEDPDRPQSAVSRQSQKTRMLIIEKKRERMLGDIAQDLRKTHGKIAEHVLSRFNQAADAAGPCTAQVLSRGKVVALATVVREDGYLVTKASELAGPPRIRLNDQEYRGQVVNGNGPNDLVLIKIDAKGLTPVRWAHTDPRVGSLLVSPSPDRKPLAMSVVGVDARPIPKAVNNLKITADDDKPFLGVVKLETSNQPKGVVIGEVAKDTPAEQAGLEAGDIVTAIGEQPIEEVAQLVNAVHAAKVGQVIQLSVQRGEKSLTLEATLAKRTKPKRAEGNKPRDDSRSAAQVYSARGGDLSDRRTNFPSALTHDGVIWASDIGGPVVNLQGEAVGLNIARYGRTATYALPAEHAKQMIEELMRGR